MARRGAPFRGALFAGLMLTQDGPRVLEFNVRCGDPETQAILPRLGVALAPLLRECADGRLSATGVLPVEPFATVGLCLAAAGYPDAARGRQVISGIDAARAAGALVFGGGISTNAAGELETAGGRVLTVVGRGPNVADAADHAYAAAALIDYQGKWLRRDIGRPLATAGAAP
jgi:phosphoribosylamine--glycine ligase